MKQNHVIDQSSVQLCVAGRIGRSVNLFIFGLGDWTQRSMGLAGALVAGLLALQSKHCTQGKQQRPQNALKSLQ